MANQLIHFGKLSLLYEDGFVRYIRIGDIEIIRKIFFALRDGNWATADIVRSDERISVTTKGFDISYTAMNVVGSTEVFRWNVKITGNESGEIDFSVDGEALSEYTRNRAGICVLHPMRETKDKIATITRPDGSVYEKQFPSIVSPHQPFLDIRKMKWPLARNAFAELEFEGDIFEMEDQRNWSDTSFKTYSTPLSIPFPVTLKPGDRVSQRVKMKLVDASNLQGSDGAEDIEVSIHNDSNPFPEIGTSFADESDSSSRLHELKSLSFDHLRIELRLTGPSMSWREKLHRGIQEAILADTRIFIHLVMDDMESWKFLEEEIEAINKPIHKIAISPIDRKADMNKLLLHAVPKARKLFPGALIGAGYISYFTELNRNRFDYSEIDFIIYPLNPQAHSTDSLTIIENLPAQEDVVKSAKLLSGQKKVNVGQVSLKNRFNPDAKPGTAVDPKAQFDPRQQTPLAAGWMLGSVKYLSEGGADSITLFESYGLAGYFSSDQLFPVYHTLIALRKLKPVKVIKSSCNDPLTISSLVVEDADSKRTLILVNHTTSKKTVTVEETLYTLADNEIKFISIS